ncbi:hypothetical protein CJU90_0649 [Yarrowia sp. C11]|nr:hypothetical protein CKK34_2061 [Yarrowia sp. E02]KAG5372987.1 hypothetical protein CJU90_0649 [Yarrowia sp. C11]
MEAPFFAEHGGYAKYLINQTKAHRADPDRGFPVDAVSMRRIVTSTPVRYNTDYGADNRWFFMWLRDLLDIQPDGSLEDEDAEYFADCQRRFSKKMYLIPSLSVHLQMYPICDADSMRKFIQRAWYWTQSLSEDEKVGFDDPEDSACALCCRLGRDDGSDKFHHHWKSCAVIAKLGFRKYDNTKDWGEAIEQMLLEDSFLSYLIEIKKTLQKKRFLRAKQARKARKVRQLEARANGN